LYSNALSIRRIDTPHFLAFWPASPRLHVAPTPSSLDHYSKKPSVLLIAQFFKDPLKQLFPFHSTQGLDEVGFMRICPSVIRNKSKRLFFYYILQSTFAKLHNSMKFLLLREGDAVLRQ